MKQKAAPAYGLALLIVFISSAILMVTSVSLILGPMSSGFLGQQALDGSNAQQLAEKALDLAQADILTQQAAGTAITTSYRYPSSGTNTLSLPTYPSSGSSVASGAYYVTVTYARGFSFVLKANVTVGSNSLAVSRLVQLQGAPADPTASAIAIYSLRKVKSSYSGYAVNVRCASNPSGATTADIGFDGSGNFDLLALRTCLGDTALPLDVAAGAKAAYGLRKLRSAYSGYAIRVRRSSDNTTQDIGFDSNGNLDTVALKSFVGSSNGFVRIWYDQSGSGWDAWQTGNADQPRIVSAGVIDTLNGSPTLRFDGASDYLYNTSLGGTAITGANLTSFLVGQLINGVSGTDYEFLSLHKSSNGTQSGYYNNDIDLFYINGLYLGSYLNDAVFSGTFTGISSTAFQATSYHDSNASNNSKIYANGSLLETKTISMNLSPNWILVGVYGNGTATGSYFLKGNVSEAIIFNAALSTANRQAIERSQGHYYNISGLQDGYVTTWYDQSGNGRDATQATAANQPVLKPVALVSPTSYKLSPGVAFDGSNDGLATAASTAWPSGANARTMSVVYQYNNMPTGAGGTAFFYGSGANGNSSAIDTSTVASAGDGFLGWGGTSYNIYAGNSLDARMTHRVTASFDGSNVVVYLNGSATANGARTVNTTSNTTLNLGKTSSGSYPYYMDASIAEAILYNAVLSSSQVSTLNTAQTSAFGN